MKPRLLLIGPLPRPGMAIGGTQVSFERLVRGFAENGTFEIETVDTTRGGGALGSARSLARVLLAVWSSRKRCDAVIFNASSRGVVLAGPLVWTASRLAGRPLVLRLFGGSFDRFLAAAPTWRRRWVERTILRSPLVLLQTRALIERFEDLPAARFFPTTRDLPLRTRPIEERCRRFLFLSQVRAEKGIVEALAASDTLGEDCSLTVRGPLLPGTDASMFAHHPRAGYGGEASPEEVPAILQAHDALVFPTWHEGEGIPGVLIEAMQCGLPVIATRWSALGEVVEDGRNGLLVAPKSAAELASAMNRLARDASLYARLSGEALARGEWFRSPPWHAVLESWLLSLCARQEFLAARKAA